MVTVPTMCWLFMEGMNFRTQQRNTGRIYISTKEMGNLSQRIIFLICGVVPERLWLLILTVTVILICLLEVESAHKNTLRSRNRTCLKMFMGPFMMLLTCLPQGCETQEWFRLRCGLILIMTTKPI